MRWGLIPSWAKDATIGARMINARAETAAEKPAFKEAIARRRCIVPADGFYHWQYSTRYRDSETNRLEALGKCIPPSSKTGAETVKGRYIKGWS